MRTAEIDYDLEIGGIHLLLTVNYAIEFASEGLGSEDVSVVTTARPESIQGMIGGMPFSLVKWEDVCKDYPLYDWIRARASEITMQACGYTLEEALNEALEDEDELRHQSSQIGRPL